MPIIRKTGRRQLVCSWCSQSFLKQEHLARHIRSHTLEKPFACGMCKKSFSRNDTLLRHSRGHCASLGSQPARRGSLSNERQLAPNSISSGARSVSGSENAAIVLSEEFHQNVHESSSVAVSDQLPAFGHLFEGHAQQAAPVSSIHSHGGDTIQEPLELFSSGHPTWPSLESPPSHSSEDIHTATTSSYMNLNGLLGHHPHDHATQQSSLNSHIPRWLTPADFDLNAFHSSIIDAFPGWPLNDQLGGPSPVSIDGAPRVAPKKILRREDVVRQHWPTTLPSNDSEHSTPDSVGDRTKVDEIYRQNLFQKLQPRVPHDPLPSTDFLNLCIQMYFEHFNPILPLIHAPTFRPSSESSLLLLSMCSVGSLFLGAPGAMLYGQNIFERLNKAILASWEKILSSGKSEALAMTQAGVIGQTYGMLSGRPKDLLQIQGLHGTVITWARRCGIFEQTSPDMAAEPPEHDTESAWKSWAKKEELSRVATALYIQDAEYSALFNTIPLLRHSRAKLPPLCANDVWIAPSASDWKTLATNAPRDGGTVDILPTDNATSLAMPRPATVAATTAPQLFSVYSELEGIAALIFEARELDNLAETSHHHETALLQYYDKYLRRGRGADQDEFSLHILWHATFISLLADLNRLEMCAGREGYEQSRRHIGYGRSWAKSQDAQRCAVHGVLILRLAEKMSVGAAPAIHVPRALFCAALVWYCYMEFAPEDPDNAPLPNIDAPEFDRLDICGQKVLFEAHGFKHARPTRLESVVNCRLHDLLGRIGHWEISRKFASLIICMVYGYGAIE